MRVCLIGGIFGKPASYRNVVQTTPETVLLDGLRRRGVDAEPRGHFGPFGFAAFDLVHVHHLSYGALAAVADAGSAQVVFTPHCEVPPGRLRQRAMRHVIARADAVVALSHSELGWQRARYRAHPARQVAIPNGIDVETFRFAPPPPAREPFELLFVGQLAPVKRVPDLLEALALLPPGRFRLRLVYQIATQKRALEQRTRELGLDNVEFAGAMTPHQLAAAYRAAHILVLPSGHTEALPSVVTEALLTGRPVVATRVAAVPEQVRDFGKLVPVGAPCEFAAALARVAADYDRYRVAARDVAEQTATRVSIDAMVEGHLALYTRLLDSGRSARRGSVPLSLAARTLGRRAGVRAQRAAMADDPR